MYEIAMANGLIDIVHVPKPHKVVAATEDGKQVPFKLLQVWSSSVISQNLLQKNFRYTRCG